MPEAPFLAQLYTAFGVRRGRGAPARPLYAAAPIPPDSVLVQVAEMVDTLPDGKTQVPAGRVVETRDLPSLATVLFAAGVQLPLTYTAIAEAIPGDTHLLATLAELRDAGTLAP